MTRTIGTTSTAFTTTSYFLPLYSGGGKTIWCLEFVLWSCWGVVDPGMDCCDMCGCPRAAHPVLTEEDEVQCHATRTRGLR